MQETTTPADTDSGFMDGFMENAEEFFSGETPKEPEKETEEEVEEEPEKQEEPDKEEPDKEEKGEETEEEDKSEEEEEEEDPYGDTPTSKEGKKWKALKDDIKTAKSELAEMQAKYDQLQQEKEEAVGKLNEVDQAELDQLREYKVGAEKELAASRVEATEEYKRLITNPLSEMAQVAQGLAEAYEIDVKDIESMVFEDNMRNRDRMIAKLIEDEEYPEGLRTQLYKMAENGREIVAHKNRLKDNAETVYAEIQANAEEASKAQSMENSKAFQRSVGHVIDKLGEHKGVFGEDAISELKSGLMGSSYESKPDADTAYNMAAGRLLPSAIEKYNQSQAEVAKLKKEISQLTASKPSAASEAPATKSEKVDDSLSFTGALDSFIGR